MAIHPNYLGCTCDWNGDDHYGTIIREDPNCPKHDWAKIHEERAQRRAKEEAVGPYRIPCPNCNGSGRIKNPAW